jgi:hypothetical protein
MGLRASRLVGAVALVVALGAGCGDDRAEEPPDSQGPAAGSSSPAASDAAQTGKPDCSEVWSDGATLPRSYAGCNAAGVFVAKDRLACSSGQTMVRYDDQFYAVLGGTIHASKSSLDDDVRYRKAIASCRG